MFRLVSALLLMACFSIVGCSGAASRIEPPPIPDSAANDAVSKYDKNGDKTIDGAELDQIPSIKSALKRFDSNNDKKVSADEIHARIESWQKSKIGRLQVPLTVFMDGQELVGAEVQLIPESFLGSGVQAASGITDNNGSVMLRLSGKSNGVGMQVGLYKIVISKKTGSSESIPEKYNKNSNLGVEVASDNSALENGWTLKLSK